MASIPRAKKEFPFQWWIWTPSNAWLLGSTRVYTAIGILIGSAVFADLTVVTDRQTDRHTDRPRYSVCGNA